MRWMQLDTLVSLEPAREWASGKLVGELRGPNLPRNMGIKYQKPIYRILKNQPTYPFPVLDPPKNWTHYLHVRPQPRFDSDPYHPSGICQQCISCSWFFRKARGRPKLAALTGPWIDLGEARSVDLEIYALLCVKSQDTHFFETYRGFGKLWRHRSKACLTTSPQKGTSRKSSMTK